eukprot:TRINITY_DN6661_c0_g1_i1.p1 TRINITY_DN6661_c0_g1~~TRINITY_DN6661_c0_g1_i1.p1  ORF type:complete len:257 (-),score=44.75 TRINITY_DN6661_c0_g1_i1:186-956(-)
MSLFIRSVRLVREGFVQSVALTRGLPCLRSESISPLTRSFNQRSPFTTASYLLRRPTIQSLPVNLFTRTLCGWESAKILQPMISARSYSIPSLSTIIKQKKTEPVEPRVIFDCHRPYFFRSLTALALLQTSMWCFMAQTSFMIDPNGPLWRPALFASTGLMFIGAVRAFGKYYLGRVTILPHGQMVLSTHTMFGNLESRTVSATSVCTGKLQLTEVGMINSKSFARLRIAGETTAYLVDVTKGKIVEQDTFVRMLS